MPQNIKIVPEVFSTLTEEPIILHVAVSQISSESRSPEKSPNGLGVHGVSSI